MGATLDHLMPAAVLQAGLTFVLTAENFVRLPDMGDK